MDESNAEDELADLVGKVLRVTSAVLRKWLAQEVDIWPPDRFNNTEPRDPSYLIWVALNYHPLNLDKTFGREGRDLFIDLRRTRNRWAHHIPFDDLDAVRALDTCRRVLKGLGAEEAAETVETQARGILIMPPIPEPTGSPTPSPVPQAAPALVSGEVCTHRRMRDPAFRQDQWEHRFDPHVEPINELVDDLIEERTDSWMPYIPSYHGGNAARILLIFQDPGRMTSTDFGGSGFLGCENDDPSAQVVAECLDMAGVDPKDVISWNAYPWFLPDQGGLTVSMLESGLEPLDRLISLLDDLQTVVTQGSKAHDSWARFSRRYPSTANRYHHLETFHTSGRGITNGGQQTKAEGVRHVIDTYTQARSDMNK